MTEVKDLETNYVKIRPSYDLVARHVCDLITTNTPLLKIHTIESRAKSVASLLKKSNKRQDGETKYIDPLNQITDLAGVRVICFLKETVDEICASILSMFKSEDIEDVGDRIFQKGRFGYQSKHIIVSLPKDTYLPDCSFVESVTCEIQVRTILQHAWAEMEHDIQYKGETIPTNLQKKFAALAGLLEIADGEFQRIQQDSLSIKNVVEADLMSRLTAETLQENPQGLSQPGSITSIRSRIAIGDYQEALDRFNQKIGGEPTSYTLFVGRAKVKFLLGDSSGALADLEIAAGLNQTDPAIPNLKSLIESGDIESVRSSGASSTSKKIEDVFQSLRLGNGVKAFDEICELENAGYNKAFALINKVMCCALERDIEGAEEYLSRLNIIDGTPMSVNILALRYIIAKMKDENGDREIEEIKAHIPSVPHFSIVNSHLRNMLYGLSVKDPLLFSGIRSELLEIPQFLGDL